MANTLESRLDLIAQQVRAEVIPILELYDLRLEPPVDKSRTAPPSIIGVYTVYILFSPQMMPEIRVALFGVNANRKFLD